MGGWPRLRNHHGPLPPPVHRCPHSRSGRAEVSEGQEGGFHACQVASDNWAPGPALRQPILHTVGAQHRH